VFFHPGEEQPYSPVLPVDVGDDQRRQYEVVGGELQPLAALGIGVAQALQVVGTHPGRP